MLQLKCTNEVESEWEAFKMQQGTGADFAFLVLSIDKKSNVKVVLRGAKADLEADETAVALEMMRQQVQVGKKSSLREDGFEDKMVTSFVKGWPTMGWCFWKGKLFCVRYVPDSGAAPAGKMIFANTIESFLQGHVPQLQIQFSEEADMQNCEKLDEQWEAANRI